MASCINQLTFNYAVDRTTAGNTALILASAPAFAALFATLAGHEHVRLRHWAALAVSVSGVALVIEGGAGLAGVSLLGDLLAVGAAVSWAGYSVMMRPLFARYSASRISALMLLVGGTMLLPFGLPQAAQQDWGSLTGLEVAAWVYSTVGPLLITNVLYFRALRGIGASRATLYMYLQPFLGALFAALAAGRVGDRGAVAGRCRDRGRRVDGTAASGSHRARVSTRRATLPLYLGGFLGPFGGAVLAVLIPELRDAFDATTNQVALAVPAYLVPFAALQVVSGTLGERIGRRRAVRGAYLVYAASLLASAAAPTIGVFLASRAVQGAANAFTSPLLLAGLADAVPAGRRARAVGTFAGVQAGGLSMAPLWAGSVPRSAGGWRSSCRRWWRWG